MEVLKSRLVVALVLGIGFTSLLFLVLKALMALTASMLLLVLLLPGGVVTALLSGSKGFSHPLVVLAANALVYSGAAFLGVSTLWRNVSAHMMYRVAIRLVAPAAILLNLACIPALNPLWPRGMAELAIQERELQDALPLGTRLDEVRSLLRSKGIAFQEKSESSETLILKRDDKSITAAAGDHVVSSRFETGAGQFPCGYDIEIVLLFGQDEKLKQQYIHRLRVCP
jgi:hypothetical protein